MDPQHRRAGDRRHLRRLDHLAGEQAAAVDARPRPPRARSRVTVPNRLKISSSVTSAEQARLAKIEVDRSEDRAVGRRGPAAPMAPTARSASRTPGGARRRGASVGRGRRRRRPAGQRQRAPAPDRCAPPAPSRRARRTPRASAGRRRPPRRSSSTRGRARRRRRAVAGRCRLGTAIVARIVLGHPRGGHYRRQRGWVSRGSAAACGRWRADPLPRVALAAQPIGGVRDRPAVGRERAIRELLPRDRHRHRRARARPDGVGGDRVLGVVDRG